MGMKTISVKAPKVNKSGSFTFDFGNDLKDAVEKFTENVVFTNFVQNATVSAQGVYRGALEKGKTPEEATEIMKTWKPGVKTVIGVDVEKAHMDKFLAMSDEERKAEIAKYQALLKSK